MSINLMEMVKGAVSQQAMKQIGGMLGTDEKKTSSIFDGVAGSLLGGMMKKAETEEGAQQVFEMAQKQDEGILDKLGDLMGGGGQEELTKQGGGLLEGIMGGQQNAMLAMIAKALGLDEGMIGKLMQMVAPIIMGVIGKQVKSSGLDASGLKSMLGEQGSNISNALPAGLGSQLGLGNLLGNAGGKMGEVASSAMGTVSGVAESGEKTADAAAEGGANMLKMVIPLLLLAGLIIAGIFLVPKLMGGGIGGGATKLKVTSDNIEEVEKEVKERFVGLAAAIKDVKDVESAKSVGEMVDETVEYLSGLNLSAMQAPELRKLKVNVGLNEISRELKTVYDASDEVEATLAPHIKKLVEVQLLIIEAQN